MTCFKVWRAVGLVHLTLRFAKQKGSLSKSVDDTHMKRIDQDACLKPYPSAVSAVLDNTVPRFLSVYRLNSAACAVVCYVCVAI